MTQSPQSWRVAARWRCPVCDRQNVLTPEDIARGYALCDCPESAAARNDRALIAPPGEVGFAVLVFLMCGGASLLVLLLKLFALIMAGGSDEACGGGLC